ncbi:S8 family peptidase [Bradyrhizobium sp. CCBAU 45384]|uniref:S8 family peptidase n=1 Tax=Bradyrhizobium sp. CCBAU 45384 TaxID=858428 RepID=UPI002305FDDD|nr:S8 family peptidase [Bradyrhizobium sp. CCBAU 45384]
MIEADINHLDNLARAIEHPVNYPVQADISRVESLSSFTPADRTRGRSLDDLWQAAPEEDGGRLFVVWLAPFRTRQSREVLLEKVELLSRQQVLLPAFPSVRLLPGPDGAAATEPPRDLASQRQSGIARAMRNYRNTGVGRGTVRIASRDALGALLASGTSYRIDPVRTVRVAAPGEGAHPAIPVNLDDAPIVGVVDGGLHAASYASAEAWRTRKLVTDAQADRKHGSAISSLVVQGHAWNTNRNLPDLNCRIGTVQAVPARNSNARVDEQDLIDHLADAMRAHPETKVWNISANQVSDDPETVSLLGHELTGLSRHFGVLPVVSVGNVSATGGARPEPPADCEAAIVVGGRQANAGGNPADPCPRCLGGPGPDGMLRPDVSWFSELRMLGGVTDIGSSYPTALVSSLAAHTFANLRNPTPDLVKALLVSASELDEHHPQLGWGTPYQGTMPWSCAPGTVALTWTAQLQPGVAYYWSGIPIPPEMVHNGKFRGRATLTAVLKPVVSPFADANYFATRLVTSLQYPVKPDDWKSLLGTMLESTIPEGDARENLKKWQPIRRHCRDFSKGAGLAFSGNQLRLYARIYARDLYQFGWQTNSDVGAQEVAFVLTLRGPNDEPSIYNSTAQALGNFVESAVINQEIEIKNEN